VSRTAALGRGELVTRLTDDIDAVADVIVRSVVPTLVAATTGILAVGFTAALSVPAATVLTCGLLVAGIGAPWAVSRSVRTAEARRAGAGERWAAAVDRVLTDSAALRVRGTLRPALAEAGDTARGLSAAEESGAPARAAGAGLSVFASAATVVGVLVVATVGYLDGGAPVHSPQWFGVLVLLATTAFEATSALPEAAEAATRATGAATRLAALTDPEELPVPAVVGSTHVSDTPHLRASGLGYGHGRTLGTVDLDLPCGSRHTVTAASGTGKTTLLLTLAGLLPPREGQVTLDGVLVDGINPELLHRTVAYLPEDAHIFATTVRDNLAVGAPDAPDDLMLSVLEAVGLSGWVAGLPEGLSTVLVDGVEGLSGGQRRRLLLARMLLTDAPVLLLDEPFEHLDAEGTVELDELLASDRLPGTRPVRTLVVVRHPR
jgi:ATP-binding cassette subfamily C protein CydC